MAGLPACLYAVQGVLTYISHQHLDSVTFNGLSQTKTLSAALCCYLVMGKAQSPLQMVALALLFVSAIVFQKNDARNNTSSSSTANQQSSFKDKFLAMGVIPCLAATFISGLAGALSQRGLQIVGGNGRNAFLYTVEVSFFSAVALLVPELFSSWKSLSGNANESNGDKQQYKSTMNPFQDWDKKTLIPVTCKALGGILTALVHKHAGSVVKGFALMLGLVMSGILQSLWSEVAADKQNSSANPIVAFPQALKWHQVVGISIVMFSSWLHFTNPPK